MTGKQIMRRTLTVLTVTVLLAISIVPASAQTSTKFTAPFDYCDHVYEGNGIHDEGCNKDTGWVWAYVENLILGHGHSRATQGINFYVGSTKTLNISIDMIFSGGTRDPGITGWAAVDGVCYIDWDQDVLEENIISWWSWDSILNKVVNVAVAIGAGYTGTIPQILGKIGQVSSTVSLVTGLYTALTLDDARRVNVNWDYTFSPGWHTLDPGVYCRSSILLEADIAYAAAGAYIEVTIDGIAPPDIPMVSGPDTGDVGVSYDFCALSSDPNYDNVKYLFDWGDGSNSGWTSYTSSGNTVCRSHSYSVAGRYDIKVYVWDLDETESFTTGNHTIYIGQDPGPDPEDPGNVAPAFQFLSPLGSEQDTGGGYGIHWLDSDPDDDATILLKYDTDTNYDNFCSGIVYNPDGMPAVVNEDDTSDYFYWDTTNITEGTYYICAVIDDSCNPQLIKYSPGTIEVDHPNSGNHFELTDMSAWIWNDDSGENNPTYINGIPEGEETLEVVIPIRNKSGTNLEFVEGVLSSSAGPVDFTGYDDEVFYGDMNAGQTISTAGLDDYEFRVNSPSYDNAPFTLHLTYRDTSNNWYEQNLPFNYTFPTQGSTGPVLVASPPQIDDAPPRGDGDGIFESVECIDFLVPITNNGNAPCVNGQGIIEQSTIWGSDVFSDLVNNYPDIATGQTEVSPYYYDSYRAPKSFAGDINATMRVWYGPDRTLYKDVNFTLTVVPTAHIYINPLSTDFGLVSPGTPVSVNITVTNNGSGDLNISSLTPSHGDISITGISIPITIAPGDNTSFTVDLDTTLMDGFVTREIYLSSNDYFDPLITISLTGTVGIAPEATYVKLWEISNSVSNDYNNVVVGDTDNDGLTEIIVSTQSYISAEVYYPGRLMIYEDNGSGSFSLKWESSLMGGIIDTHGMGMGDFDNDGYGDIAVACESQLIFGGSIMPYKVRWFEATGNDSWTDRGTPITESIDWLQAMTLADSDNDGVEEVIVARRGGPANNPRVMVYEYSGGSFVNRWTSPLVLDQGGDPVDWIPVVTCGDSDGDGNNEIIFSTDDAQIYVYERTANNSYTQRFLYEDEEYDYLGTWDVADIEVADSDGDGHQEIIYTSDEGYVFILESTANNVWNTATPENFALPTWGEGYCIAVGDTDNDNVSELVIGGDPNLWVYECIADNSHAISWESSDNEVTRDVVDLAMLPTGPSSPDIIVTIIDDNDYVAISYQQSIDLQISNSNISFNPVSPINENQEVIISGLIQNLGSTDANDVKVQFYDGNPASGGSQIGSDVILPTVVGQSQELAQVSWTPTASGIYDIYLIIDPDNTIPEWEDILNNSGSKTMVVNDDDTDGPVIEDVEVEEHNGDGDGLIEDDEEVRISWSATDPAGINGCICTVDGTPYAATGTYEVVVGPLAQGTYGYTVTATDDDNSQESSQEPGDFMVYSHAPSVTNVSPTNGSVDISICPQLEATFDESLDQSTINASTVILKDAALQPVSGMISYQGAQNKIIFIPTEDLKNSHTYTATLVGSPSGIASETGNDLETSYDWSFTTEPDATPPTGIISYPDNGDYAYGLVGVQGTAWDVNFDSYQVYYGVGTSPAVWTPIGSAGTQPVISGTLCQWDASALSDGEYSLKLSVWDQAPASNQTDVTTSFTISPNQTVIINLKAGWNMVSVPVIPDDTSVSSVLPDAQVVYTWNADTKSYVIPTVIEPEKGYWVAVMSNMDTSITGVPVGNWTSPVKAGWNMVGSVIENTDFSSPDDNPDGSVQGFGYWWNPLTKSYDFCTTFETGKGYWAASTADCDLTLSVP